MTSMVISITEIVIHQVLAVHFLGWDTGFQYFIPVVAIFPFLIPKGNVLWKWAILLLCMSGSFYIEFFLRKEIPLYHISHTAVVAFDIANIILAYSMFAMWAIYLTIAVNRSQIIIEEKTKEITKVEEAAKQAEIQIKLEMKEHENALITREKQRYEELLLNILPYEVAQELKEKGKSEAKLYDLVTVMFTDFKGFTMISEKLSPVELVAEIDYCFKAFDNIITSHGIEKIKTIGDSYMAAGGLPVANKTHAGDVVSAALEIREFMRVYNDKQKSAGKEVFEIRIGIHTGPVVAGIVGIQKFAYDIWGDTVNIASRMESSCQEGEINISGGTYEFVRDAFICKHRGKIDAKNKGQIDMYFVEGEK